MVHIAGDCINLCGRALVEGFGSRARLHNGSAEVIQSDSNPAFRTVIVVGGFARENKEYGLISAQFLRG